MEQRQAITLNTWAGTRYYPVQVIRETAKRCVVRIMDRPVMLPGKRYAEPGDVVTVPKYCVLDVPESKIAPQIPRFFEPSSGRGVEYGGTTDAA